MVQISSKYFFRTVENNLAIRHHIQLLHFVKKNSHDVKEKLFSDENSKPIEKTKDSLQINVPFHRKYTPVR